jgi:predicted AAA+ superfamily ATPase
MLRRLAARQLRSALSAFPAAVIVGPRQCGKTTLARMVGGEYFDLEQESERVRLDLEWDRLAAGRVRVLLDEAQSFPAVFPRLRAAIDRDRRRNGRFLLLGSVSPMLMRTVAESLAGRMAVIELTPFLLGELKAAPMRSRRWLTGGFPDGGVRRSGAFPRWQSNYLRLLVERDLPAAGIPCRPQVTERFLRMLAALTGQQWNASELGRSLGVNYQSAAAYADYVEGCFLIRRLPAFHGNLSKRLVKAPRLHWRDSGLLHALLGVHSMDELLSHPGVGASWEGYVVEQCLGTLSAIGIPHQAFHFRTSDGYELDLVVESGRERWAIEIKLTSDPSPHDLARLDRCAAMVSATRAFLVSRVARDAGGGARVSCGLERMLRELSSLAGPPRRARPATPA